jgi:hypothetical protein
MSSTHDLLIAAVLGFNDQTPDALLERAEGELTQQAFKFQRRLAIALRSAGVARREAERLAKSVRTLKLGPTDPEIETRGVTEIATRLEDLAKARAHVKKLLSARGRGAGSS